MKRILVVSLTALFLSACASTGSKSGEAEKNLTKKWNPMVGVATKADFVENYGNAEWCQKNDNDEETCRFYKKGQTKWMGDKKDRKSYDTYDQVVADFDQAGKLKSFKADAQR